jgi:hypothetical protein
MKINPVIVIPLVKKLGDFLKVGADHYVTMRASGIEPDADMIALFLVMKMEDWNPQVRGKHLMDDDTRAACARFLAGVAFNFAATQAEEEAA